MNTLKLITAVLLILPGLSWGGEAMTISAPEPGLLPLLAVGGIVVAVVHYMRGKK
jgi:hypothetical protein